jgi:hypothetical protein
MRIAAFALILASGTLLTHGQQITPKNGDAQQTAIPRAVPPLPKGYKVLKQPVSLSPDAFTYLIVNNQLSLSVCRKWIGAASALSEGSFLDLKDWLYSETAERLRNCVQDFPALSLADVRKASLTIFRFEQAKAISAVGEALQQAHDNEKQKTELENTQRALDDMTSKYNGLLTLSSGLQQERDKRAEDLANCTHGFQQQTESCLRSISEAIDNGVKIGRQSCNQAYSPAVRCRTEYVPGLPPSLQTVCQ